jgi:methionyl-tRNA synthetase
MIRKYRDGRVPDAEAPPELVAAFAEAPARVIERFDAIELTGALDEIWSLVRRLNAFVQEEQPWQLAKDESQGGRLDRALYALAEGLRVVSLLLVPFMPEATDKLLTALGHEDRSLESARFGSVGGGARCDELEPLFPRVEAPASA